MYRQDTIVARASAAGAAGVAVVRVSGPDAMAMLRAVTGRKPAPRRAVLCEFRDDGGQVIDSGLVIAFPGPASFTGEDVVEFHGHGGPIVVAMLIRRLRELGARPARPGEFSERAFLNDKLDLAQAEAIADLVGSGSEQAARAALRSLRGDFSAAVQDLQTALTTLRVHVEAAIDFPEEEIDFLDDDALRARIASVRSAFDDIAARAATGRALSEGLSVALIGAPNVGKSSLLNALSGEDTAIVTDVPGTTRDLVETRLVLDGLPLTVVDTAGLRETDDVVEREGVRRSARAAGHADHLLVMLDRPDPAAAAALVASLVDAPRVPPAWTLVVNKIDLSGQAAGKRHLTGTGGPLEALFVSAKSGAGLDNLKQHLHGVAGIDAEIGGGFSARQRHIDLLAEARAHFERGARQLQDAGAGELLAEELRLAQQSLGGITGEQTADDLLGEIFSSFCIGK